MKLNLLRNGLGSLEFGWHIIINICQYQINMIENSGFIKLAVICIQNAVEILFKKS